MPNLVDLGGLGSRGFPVHGVEGASAGRSISAAGDFNGDGFDDILIGAPYDDVGGTNAGSAYVIYGHGDGFGAIDLNNLPSSAGFRIQGDIAGDIAGLSVSTAGDVNGDGFDDIIVVADRIIGAFGYGDTGRTYVIFGKADRAATLDLSDFSPSDGFLVTGPFSLAYYHSLSVSASGAGDVNGDGFDDIVIGARYAHGYAGAAYVVFGRAGSVGTLDVANLGPATGFAIFGAASSDGVGLSVSAAGDVNGDGFDDIIIGARGGDDSPGVAYVIFGKAGVPTIDLAHLDPAAGFLIRGDAIGDSAGFSVSDAGDFNGDGLDDVIVGAPFGDEGSSAYVIFGRAGGFSTIDLGNLGAAGIHIEGQGREQVGWAVSAAGDVNHDGFDDVIIGAPSNDAGQMDAGRGYVIFGRAGSAGTIDLSNLASTDGFIIQGTTAAGFAGWSVAGAGDINRDGFADLLIGTPFSQSMQADVVFGTGIVNAAISRAGDFNGDGRDDILWRSDTGRVTDWLGQAGGGFVTNFVNADSNAGLDWQLAAVGDFNGDHRDDLLWRNANGDLFEWLGQANGGFASNSANSSYTVSTSWHIVGSGDFNGDGRSDILWRDGSGRVTDWLGQANGSFATNFSNADANAGNDWHIVSIGDFNGDGRDDVLWRNDNGDLFDWLGQLNGSFASNSANGYYHVDTSWQIVGTGDFNGDDRDDILWRNSAGRVTDWLGQANGGFAGNFANADANAGTDWQIVSTGDFNGDHRDDILWRNQDGSITNWLGQPNGGFQSNFSHAYYQVADNWHVHPQEIFA